MSKIGNIRRVMADCTLNLNGVVTTADVKDPRVGAFEKGDKFS
jgi:hypothetical protein